MTNPPIPTEADRAAAEEWISAHSDGIESNLQFHRWIHQLAQIIAKHMAPERVRTARLEKWKETVEIAFTAGMLAMQHEKR